MAALEFTQRTEFESYVYNQEHTVDVLVTLRAARSVEQTSRAQLCLSACIDRSGSMAGGKLDLVKRTLQFVVHQLGDTDKLGLVTYDDAVDEAFKMKEMTTAGRQEAENAVKRVHDGGMTNLSGGLFKSIEQITHAIEQNDHGNPGPVHAVLLLTDGLANRGITDSTRLQQALEATLNTGPPIKIHTFGYGNDHSSSMLKAIADTSEGNYYFIEKEDDVPTHFADALGGLASVVVQNTVLEITSAHANVRIEKVFTGLKMTHNAADGSYKIQSSDLYSEERKDIMVRLKVPALEAPVEADALLNVTLSYFDIPAAGCVNNEAIVCVKRPAEVPENQVADEDFLDQRLRFDVADVYMNAAQLMEQGEQEEAEAVIVRGLKHAEMFPCSAYNAFAQRELRGAKLQATSRAAAGGQHFFAAGFKSHVAQRSAPFWRSRQQKAMVEKAVESTGTQLQPGNAPDTQLSFPKQESEAQPPAQTRSLPRIFPMKKSPSQKKDERENKDQDETK